MPFSRNHHRRALLTTAAMVTAVMAIIVYGTILQLLDERDAKMEVAAQLLREQAHALGAHIVSNMQAAEVAAGAVAALVTEGAQARGAEPFPDIRGRWLDGLVNPRHRITSIQVYDRSGRLMRAFGARADDPLDVSDESSFKVHRDFDRPAFIDRPRVDAATGHWSIAVSRRIADAGGRFLGIARVVTEPLESYRLYSQPGVASTFLAVADGDGTILMSRPLIGPDGAYLIGRSAHSVAPFLGLPADALAADGQRTVDEHGMLIVVDHPPRLPLVVIVGRSHADILAGWRSEAFHHAWLIFGTALLGAALFAVAWHYARQRRRVEADLEQSRTAAELDRNLLETLYDTAPVGLTLIDRDMRYVRINQTMARITGADRIRDIGRSVREVVPDLADLVEPVYRRVFETGKPVVNFELSGTTPARPGELRHWLCSYHPVYDGRGAVAGLNGVIQEVTDLKRLHETHALMMAALEASPDFVGFADAERRPTFINRAGRRLLGIGEDEDISRLAVPEFYEPASRQVFLEEVRPAANRDGAWRGELTLIARDGREIASHQTLVALRAADGTAAFYATFIRDISSLKQAEEKLLRREEHFRALIENASDLISVIDTKGTITYQSPSSQMLGYRPEELVDHNYAEFVHPDDLEACRRALAAVATDIGGVASAEFRMRQKDGGWRVLHAIGRNAMHRRAIRGIVVNARDVTAIRQAEATHARLAAALDGASEGFALFDRDDRLVYFNPEFHRVARVGDILVPGVRYEDIMRAAVERGYIGAALGNEEAWLRDHLVAHSASTPPRESFRAEDGTWLRVRSKKLADGSTFIAYTDITVEKVRAEELRQAQKMEVVGKLTAGVAHDFNNLLTAVIGNLDLISERLPQQSGLLPLTNTAMVAAERGAKLVQQLLSFSRKQPLDPRAQNMGDVIGGMADLLRTTVGSRVCLDIVIDDHLWLCKVDAHQLEHALLNLATNARDAMPDGGSFTIKAGNLRAAVPFAALQGEVAAGDYVVISVTDTGCGMASEVARRAIEPFFTTKAVGKGSGLGLSMVCGFAKQSGGDMAIESAPGKGTRIELYLPSADMAHETTTAETEAA